MSAPKHTTGPWVVRPGVCRNDHPDTSADVHGPQGQFVADCGCHEHANANAKLIAAAPDHALLLAAIVAGVARWRPFEGNPEGAGEICVGGLAYAADLDESGCPEITDARRAALVQALHAAGRLP